jgi:hypothetical protein
MKYYIYLHIKESNGSPFYIGKGCGLRSSICKNRNNHWKNIVEKHVYDTIILQENLNETDAFYLEKYWIKRIGRNDLNLGPLVNFTDGGEGSSGRSMNENTRKILKNVNTGRSTSDKQKKIVGNRYKNKFGALHNRSKKVFCVETGDVFGSMSEAGRILNISISSVSWSVKNKKPIFGMHFQIKE